MSDKPLILITGANGYLGTRICKALEKKYTLVTLDNEKPCDAYHLKDYFYIDLGCDQGNCMKKFLDTSSLNI